MKIRIFILLALLPTVISFAQITPKWARYPSISPDGATIVFTYKGNLYSVSTNGGDATQLTFHEAHDYMAVWSKDGKTLAFASDRYGNFDIYTMDAKGGPATRLTYHSNDEKPYTFSADNSQVLFGAVRLDDVKHRQYPTRVQPELYSVPVLGGRVKQVFTVPAEYVQVSANGNQMVYHDLKGYENEFRKHHVSAIARDLWTYDIATKEHKMITSFKGEDRHPVYGTDGALYYLSEKSGSFNVHKINVDNSSVDEQLTTFDTHPVRSLSIGNGTMTFSYDGEVYTLREGEAPKKIDITIRTQAGSNSDKFISINGGVREMDISPDGKEIAFVARGEVFVTSVDGSLTKRLTNTPEQERFVKFTSDGKAVAYCSERDGKWHTYQTKKLREEEPFFFASTLINEEPLITNGSDNYLPEFSPDGKQVAYIEDRRTLKVMNLETKATVTLLTPDDFYHFRDGDKYYKWSPDSKWLLVGWGATLSNGEVLLMSADGKKRVNLTASGYYDYLPKWVNEGKQMLWFSNRDGLKSYATSGRTQSDVYSMFFTKDAWDKFNMSKEDYDLMKQIEKLEKKDKNKEEDKNKKKDKKKKDEDQGDKDEVKPLTFDWDDMDTRMARLTIHSSRLSDAVLSKDGENLYYLARFEKNYNLWKTELRTKNTSMLVSLNAERGGSLMWDKKQENLYLLSDGKIFKVDTKGAKTTPVKIKGEMQLDMNAERDYMFDHVWLRTNAIFYHSNFHGVDWSAMKAEYAKYIPHLGNSYEFSEMVSEMLGELNVSHAGGRYSRRITNPDATAALGIFMDYTYAGNGIKITEVIKGGPLDKAKYKLKASMIIEKIDGETVLTTRDVSSYLNRKADKFTLLELLDPTDNSRQQITVKPISLGAENRLLYNRWVKMNEEEVEEKSKGKLGYVHIPGMSDGPYRTIYDRMMGKFMDKKAVIVDTRFNGGGDLVADLAMFFTGVPFISYETEARKVGGEPTSRWTKPTLAMFNESMYSDGHCFASGYTDLRIGKTVGMPVPGTCSFAGWEGLPDGSRWGVVPVSAKNKSGEWMENNQTEPIIKIKNMPGMIDKGIDQQLERSIEELLKEVE
ncbi:MAG: S41 family peptidase [Fulvivirga sp.]